MKTEIKKAHLLVFCNLAFLLCAACQRVSPGDFVSSLAISLVIFIVPGLGWAGRLKDRITDSVAVVFYILCLSTFVWASLATGHYLLGMAPAPLTFLLSGAVLTNIGILSSKRGIVVHLPRIGKKRALALAISLFLVYMSVYWGMRSVPAFRDLDGEHQGTSYGLIHELRPYLTSDIVASPFYFAHPPLTNFYNALSIFFSGKLDDYRYFFDSAKNTEKVFRTSPGEEVFIEIRGISYRIVNIDDLTFLCQKKNATEDDSITLSRKMLGRFIYDQDKLRFERDPRVFHGRMSNIFASIFIFWILYLLIESLTHSASLGFLGAFIYVFSPGIFVRSSVSEHLAFTNCFLLLISYQYIFPEKFEGGHGAWRFLGVIPAVMAALTNQKMIIIILPVLIMNLIGFFKRGDKNGSLRRAVFHEPIISGYALGTLLFWVYGILIDYQAFAASHIHAHLFDRILHHNSMFIEDYPGVFRLWIEFNVEFPFFMFALFAAVFCAKRYVKERAGILILWAFCGAFIFSLVDWKQTNHLMCVVPALVVVLMVFIANQAKACRNMLIGGVFVCLAYGLWLNIKLINDFSAYVPTSGW